MGAHFSVETGGKMGQVAAATPEALFPSIRYNYAEATPIIDFSQQNVSDS